MRALAIRPGEAASARLIDTPVPQRAPGTLLARTLAIGICGTDRELTAGHYGMAPPGQDHLIIGHESLATVEESDAGSAFRPGDAIVGIVRRPDPLPCACCAAGEWDLCENGQYTERGIRERHGYGSQYFAIDERFAVKVDAQLGVAAVLLEPASIVAKAWEHIEYIGRRSQAWRPRRVLVTGAGTVGLLAAMLARQRDLETHVYDRVTAGRKPQLAHAAGAHYHAGDIAALADLRPDIVIECTGAAPVIVAAMRRNARNAIVCLAGLSGVSQSLPVDIAALNQSMVLQNDLVFGTVNANRRHYEQAAQALARADRQWLEGLLTRRIALDDWRSALQPHADDIKVVIDFALEGRSAH